MMKSLSYIDTLTMLFLDISLSSADMTQKQYPVMKILRFASVTSELLTQLDRVLQESNLHPFLVGAFFDQNLMPSMPYVNKHDIILPFILCWFQSKILRDYYAQ